MRVKPTRAVSSSEVLLGIDVLEQSSFKILKGKRVGLLTNQAGVNRFKKSTIQVLFDSDKVKLVALFAPEHGIDGRAKAQDSVANTSHPATGLPVYSLYGPTRRPTAQMLKNIDVMVIDLQDIGVRSYTYISCLRYTMEACFENGVAVVVLDRPNPLGGLKVDGPVMDAQWMSYVGAYRIPYVHGLTIGELALMAKDISNSIPSVPSISSSVRRNGNLTVIPMKGWKRSMLWIDTGLSWIPTSPYIRDTSSIFGYAMIGLGCQIGGFHHGIGSFYPFRILTFQNKTPEDIISALKSKHIPGLAYQKRPFNDSNGKRQEGVYVEISDWNALRPTEISFYLMQIAAQWSSKNPFSQVSEDQMSLFNKHTGSNSWWKEISSKGSLANVPYFISQWKSQSSDFQKKSKKYWLYRE
ncbi:MAG: hypothetical protein A2007_02355 [Verrucomicrobia bacterium GWC2_42_7]|nr:MAG: hypothetical protein A2007_02355 [Verrucomicrobia bacterium GWC2_42_7]